MMISGKHLSGDEFVYPEDWLFTNEFQTIKVETNPENPHSVTTLCFVREGKLIIPARRPYQAMASIRSRRQSGQD